MIAAWIWTGYSYLVGTACLAAGSGPGERCELAVRMTVDARQIALVAQNAPLGLVLDRIEEKTGVRIHSSMIPEPRINASCTGTTVQEMIECVFGSETDFILRDPGDATPQGGNRQAEYWIVGADPRLHQLAGRSDDSACKTADSGAVAANVTPAHDGGFPRAGPQETAELIEMATSKDPSRRIQGLSHLGTEGSPDDEGVLNTLTAALSDSDPEVRAQAVRGLARVGAENAETVLREALTDRDADVRLMAVSHLRADAAGAALLRQALADSDDTVSGLAARRLASLPDAPVPN